MPRVASSPLAPGLAPAIPVHPHQIEIAQRLHLIASAVPGSYFVSVRASDLVALLNGFTQESRRADQAEARLAAVIQARSASN